MPVILVVEDNPINRDVLGRRLEKRGYSVRFAEDGPSGIEAATKLRPDLILMDIGLGEEMDGWAATRCIKADPETAAIPIIALTASAFEFPTGARAWPPDAATSTPSPSTCHGCSPKSSRACARHEGGRPPLCGKSGIAHCQFYIRSAKLACGKPALPAFVFVPILRRGETQYAAANAGGRIPGEDPRDAKAG